MRARSMRAVPRAGATPPPGPPAVGSSPPGPPSTTTVSSPGSTRSVARGAVWLSLPTRTHSLRPRRTGTSISSRPGPLRLTQSNGGRWAGLPPEKTASVVAPAPATETRRGALVPGTSRRQTLPTLGHGGTAGFSPVIVALASGTPIDRRARAVGVRDPATSPGTGAKKASGRANSDSTTRSSSAVPRVPRRPTWTSPGWLGGPRSVTALPGSSASEAPPSPRPAHVLGTAARSCAAAAAGGSDAGGGGGGGGGGTNLGCTKAARSIGSRVRPLASTVISCATGASGMRYQTVRAKEAGPRHRGTPRSARASASAAIACCSVGTPFAAVYGANAAGAAGASLPGGAAWAVAEPDIAPAHVTPATARTARRTVIKQDEPEEGGKVLASSIRPSDAAPLAGEVRPSHDPAARRKVACGPSATAENDKVLVRVDPPGLEALQRPVRKRPRGEPFQRHVAHAPFGMLDAPVARRAERLHPRVSRREQVLCHAPRVLAVDVATLEVEGEGAGALDREDEHPTRPDQPRHLHQPALSGPRTEVRPHGHRRDGVQRACVERERRVQRTDEELDPLEVRAGPADRALVRVAPHPVDVWPPRAQNAQVPPGRAPEVQHAVAVGELHTGVEDRGGQQVGHPEIASGGDRPAAHGVHVVGRRRRLQARLLEHRLDPVVDAARRTGREREDP